MTGAEAETTASKPESKGYRLTNHILEYYKTNDFKAAKKAGWAIIGLNPARFKTLHSKMINIYDSLATRAADAGQRNEDGSAPVNNNRSYIIRMLARTRKPLPGLAGIGGRKRKAITQEIRIRNQP